MLAQSLGQLLLSQPQELMHNNNHQRPPNDLLVVMVIWRRTLANNGRFHTPNQVVAGISLRLTTMKMMMPSWNHCRGNHLQRNSASMQLPRYNTKLTFLFLGKYDNCSNLYNVLYFLFLLNQIKNELD
jgi:hypothetical protein